MYRAGQVFPIQPLGNFFAVFCFPESLLGWLKARLLRAGSEVPSLTPAKPMRPRSQKEC